MTNNTKSTQLKIGQMVFDHDSKQKGKLKVFLRDGKSAKVEIVTAQNKETGERTTKLVTVKLSNLSPYRKPEPKKYNPNEYYHMVKDFHTAFNHPVAIQPKPLSPERATDRAVWSGEELVEFIHSSSRDLTQFEQLFDVFIKGLNKAKEKSMKSETPKDELSRLVAQVDALTDEAYFNNGSFVELGILPHVPFKIVQAANMGKLHVDENGKKYAKYRESDGKIQKPDNWERDFAPEGRLKAEVERQIEKSKQSSKLGKNMGKFFNIDPNEAVVLSLKEEIQLPPKSFPNAIEGLRTLAKGKQ